ncbi:apoptosis regulator BAX-like isoform X2 [Poeciliopsis prolifica]|uniref:apoptosis regulator BAX-like isoform X2 n=1 Tax=Poeciliopsis prolifica TaxID=188132 RepID=UPI002414087C|nr:apoptosis regulator BAX-like isoform X2 [Poeciliopsis prolifica]
MSEKNTMASGGEGDTEGSFKDAIVKQLIVLLKDFIWKRIERRSLGDAERIRKVLNAQQPCTPQMQKISEGLQAIGDQVDGEVQRAVGDQTIRPSMDNYIKVVIGIFSDGEINWGRVVIVFSFTCLYVLKEGIYSYIGAPTWQTVAIFLAGVLTTIFIIHNARRA